MWSQLSLPLVELAQPAEPASFLKWVGGKKRQLSQLTPMLPVGVDFMRHVEPFLGGAAMFFARRPARALLSDKNPHLCTTYAVVRDAVEDLIEQLRVLAEGHNAERYYERRHRYNHHALEPIERAALFIYLNKSCFNGLHRVNRRGEFNVPIGRYASPRILDAETLRAASKELRRSDVRCASFENALTDAAHGDFVYLDPPYVPVSRTASFTAYGPDGFTWEDQLRLREVFVELDARGCKLMLSNSATRAVHELYRDYVIDSVVSPRSINCATAKRGTVQELVIRNYGRRVTASAPAAVERGTQLEAWV